MKNFIQYASLWAIAGVAILAALLIWAPGFAMFGETLLYWALLIAAFVTFDNYVMSEIDTINEMKSGNVSYAIFLVAIALLFNGVAILVG